MAKNKDGLDRRETEKVYEELFDEIKQTDMERRTVLRAFAGGGGLAVLNTLFAQKKFMGDNFASAMKAVEENSDEIMGVQRVDEAPYEVDESVHERHDGRNNDFTYYGDIHKWIAATGGKSRGPEYEETMIDEGKLVLDVSYGKKRIPNKFNPPRETTPEFARATKAIQATLAVPNQLLGPYSLPHQPYDVDQHIEYVDGDYLLDRDPDTTDPAALRNMIDKIARIAGAGDWGVTDLQRSKKWVYSHAGDGREIVFENVQMPQDNEEQIVIPQDMDTILVGFKAEPLQFKRMSPTWAAQGGTQFGYGLNQLTARMIATFIRAMGYRALPATGGIGLNVPLLIDAGLAEGGRHGRALHPQFGGNFRPWKIFTDLPFESDAWINFGGEQFCQGCKLCADACPVNSIPYGEKTWKYEGETPSGWEEVTDVPYNITKNEGVYKWYMNPMTCNRYTAENGSGGRSACMVTCPFTQGRNWLHDIIREVAGTSPSIDRTLVGMSEAFGYDKLHNPEETWETEFLPYALFQDPSLGEN